MPQTETLSLVTSEKVCPEVRDPEIFYSFFPLRHSGDITNTLTFKVSQGNLPVFMGGMEGKPFKIAIKTNVGRLYPPATHPDHSLPQSRADFSVKQKGTVLPSNCHFAPLHLTSKGRHCTDSFTRQLCSQKQQVRGRALLEANCALPVLWRGNSSNQLLDTDLVTHDSISQAARARKPF